MCPFFNAATLQVKWRWGAGKVDELTVTIQWDFFPAAFKSSFLDKLLDAFHPTEHRNCL